MIVIYVALGVLGAVAIYQEVRLQKLKTNVAAHLEHPPADPQALAEVTETAGANAAAIDQLGTVDDSYETRLQALEAAGPGASQADLRALGDTMSAQVQGLTAQIDDINARLAELLPEPPDDRGLSL